MTKTQIVVNPNAGNGRGAQVWRSVQPIVAAEVDKYRAAITTHPEDVVSIIKQAGEWGAERVISIGGDGTNYVVLNAIMQHNQRHADAPLTYGVLPAGTGRDWARGAGLPLKTAEAVHYVLHDACPRPIDVGYVEFGSCKRYFLNISSVGVSNAVVQRVEASRKFPWSFLQAVLMSLFTYQPQPMRVEVDGDVWYEGEIYIATVANGKYFGQGLYIAPDAQLDDGLFDVVIVEAMPLFALMRAFPLIFSGAHINHPKVRLVRGRDVRVTSMNGVSIGMDLDGEPEAGTPYYHYQLKAAALNVLL